MIPPPPPPGRCQKRIGFLFPRVCGRTDPAGCTDCRNGEIDDPYASRRDRGDYSDDYDSGLIFAGIGIHKHPHPSTDFTEADGENLVDNDSEFENDFSAS